MQCHSVNHLFSLLNLTFRTIYESCLRAHCVVLWSPRKTSSRFRNLARSLIDCDHITCNYFLFLNGLNHLLTQIINRLHLSRFKRNFTSFWSRSFNKKINYLKIFQFKFLQLPPLRFRFLPWFLHQLIFWRPEWELRFYSFTMKKFKNPPTLWKAHLNPNFWPWPWRWRFFLYLAVLRWAQLYRRFCPTWSFRGWYQRLFWLRPG